VDHSSDVCIEVLYGDSESDATYWKGYQSESVDAGFISSEPASHEQSRAGCDRTPADHPPPHTHTGTYGDLITETTFAAITNASTGYESFFEGGYSGILGMAYSGIAESYEDCSSGDSVATSTPLLDALYQAGELSSDVFSISFCGDSVGQRHWISSSARVGAWYAD
jgi:hypothetical protein